MKVTRERNWRCDFLCLAGVGVCTWASFRIGQGFAFTGFLYLVFVVLAALYGGFRSATLVSLASAACLDYFFIPPILSFANSPANWVALGAFEFTALVISHLSNRAHRRTLEVERIYDEMERLYQTSRRIMLLDNSAEAGNLIASSIREMFQLTAVQLFDAVSAVIFSSGHCPMNVPDKTRNVYIDGSSFFDSATSSWHCVLSLGTHSVGGLALVGTEMSKSTAIALASLSAIALERARVLDKECRAQADRQAEQLRASVLDALAHQFKTPLAVTRAASSGLLALGGLSELQTGFVTAIDEQARRLNDLASHLLRTARLEASEFQPQREAVLFSKLAHTAIRKLESPEDRKRVHIVAPNSEPPVFADRELILTSITQLVDNAVKYSDPGSPIDITFEIREGQIVLSVGSQGIVVSPSDRKHIFERFYRASGTRHLFSGAGLGLSIVKKIVESHQGQVWAEGEEGYGTTVSIALPSVPVPAYDYAFS